MGTDVRCSSFVNDLCSFETRHRRLELSDHMAVSSHSRPLQAPDCTSTIRGYPHPSDHRIHCQGEAFAARQNLRRLRVSNAVQNKSRRSQENAPPISCHRRQRHQVRVFGEGSINIYLHQPWWRWDPPRSRSQDSARRRTVQPLQLRCRHLQVCNKPLDEAVS